MSPDGQDQRKFEIGSGDVGRYDVEGASTIPGRPTGFRHASFFSGIGGFDLGFERNGISSVFFCEKKPFCRQVLRARWPAARIHEDIKHVESHEIPMAEVWS